VTADVLVTALRWEHRLSSAGVTARVTLADGRLIDTDQTRGVLNRLVALPDAHLRLAAPRDREYARQEFLALFLSWLQTLPGPVLNRPTPQGLSGPWLHDGEWACLAAKAGLPTGPFLQSSANGEGQPGEKKPQPIKTVFVVGDRVIGRAIPARIQEGSRQLARAAGVALLGISFGESPADPWVFAAASPLPDLRLGGKELLAALITGLGGFN
jgi:hypothetical protein